MTLQIRPLVEADIDAVVELSLLAWEPVFESFRQILGAKIFTHLFPDWRKHQSEAVAKVCRDPGSTVLVSDLDGIVTGFITYKLDQATLTGEVEYLAVHPDYHNRGIGTALNHFVLDRMKEHGMKVAVVGTGGDPAHAAARRTYEKAGYTPLPNIIYHKAL